MLLNKNCNPNLKANNYMTADEFADMNSNG